MSKERRRKQIIIHVDMDAFYASVEMRDNPALKGKALIIGSLPTERGVVSTCSYEARKYGVHSAMNIKEAYRLCPHGIYMHGNHEKYRAVSEQLREIWNDYAVVMEPIALDEAFLDVTYSAGTFERAGEMARTIKKRTLNELGLTCSVGVAYCKTAAKLASEEKKPDGYFEIPSAEDFINLMIDRDVRSLYTVGAKTAERLNSLGIHSVRDIQERREDVLKNFGKHGRTITELAFGIDERRVIAYKPEDTKSISREITFQEDVNNYQLLDDVLFLLAMSVERRAAESGLHGRGVALKLTYADMKSISRSKTVTSSDSAATIWKETRQMLGQVEKRSVRLIGAGVYKLTSNGILQMSIDDYLEESAGEKQQIINDKLAELGERYNLDFAANIDKIFTGDTLYRTVEYMRKHIHISGMQ